MTSYDEMYSHLGVRSGDLSPDFKIMHESGLDDQLSPVSVHSGRIMGVTYGVSVSREVREELMDSLAKNRPSGTNNFVHNFILNRNNNYGAVESASETFRIE